ncbi:hypothetical protein PInf_008630 [Phytophthora infestans]|nr:hypothetical protein PInf_008630 [Phytophthora infestans]
MSAQDDELTTYEETLERWALYDCSAIERARNNDEMRRLFQRFRATRGKPTTATRTVTLQSLDKAWTSFVLRWNKEGGEAFERTLQEREATHARLSVGTLEAQMTKVASAVLYIVEKDVNAVAGAAPRDPMIMSGVAFLERRQKDWRESLDYSASNVPSNTPVERWHRRGEESRDPHEKPWIQNESHRGPGPNWRYAEVYPHYAREARGRRAEREDRVRRMDAAITQRLDRLARRVEYLERENQELRHRRRRQDMAQGDHGSLGAEDDVRLEALAPDDLDGRMKM